jgi:hypothetical protein
MMVPALIRMVPAFMVPDNRVSLYVEDPAVNDKSARATDKASSCDAASAVFGLFRLDVERRPTASGAFQRSGSRT